MREKLNNLLPFVVSAGSNLGAREENVLRAIDSLSAIDGIFPLKISSLYETEPVSGDYSNNFVNLASLFITDFLPADLLTQCQKVERKIGLSIHSRGNDRIIDIDLILYDSVIIDTENLTLPHPRFLERAFVVKPMLEICPGIKIPPDEAALCEIVNQDFLSGWTRVISTRTSLSES